MFCPYCGNSCAEAHKFCFRCGKALPDLIPPIPVSTEQSDPAPVEEELSPTVVTQDIAEAQPDASEAPVPESCEPEQEAADTPQEAVTASPPQPKKGRLWPPLLFLAIMVSVGLAVFLCNNGGTQGDKSCFTVEDGTLYFDYSLYTGPDELTIPATVNGVTVTAISDGCFADCDRLTTVIIPESVTSIGANAFSGCNGLRGLYIPNGVTAVGAGALSGCTALEAVYFPSSTLAIGAKCLDNCPSLHFLFYEGTYNRWLELYNGNYPTGMELHTNDGVFYAQP